MGSLFISVVRFCLDYQYSYSLVIYIIDYAVISSDMTRPSDVIASYQCFRMSYASTRMLHYIIEDFSGFLEQYRVRLFPLAQSPVGCLREFNRIGHRLSKYRCISSGEEQRIVSPSEDSFRALLIMVRKAGVITAALRTIFTDATPRMRSKALRISDAAAPSSIVTII